MEQAETILRRRWCEAMPDTGPEADQIREAALEGTVPVAFSLAGNGRACRLSEFWPCHLSEGVADLLADPQVTASDPAGPAPA